MRFQPETDIHFSVFILYKSAFVCLFAGLVTCSHSCRISRIEVNNANEKLQMGTVRIFMVPTVDQDGIQLSFDEQRLLMIEMDKFSYPRECFLILSTYAFMARYNVEYLLKPDKRLLPLLT